MWSFRVLCGSVAHASFIKGSSGLLMASEIGFEVQLSALEEDSQSIVCETTEATGVRLD
jgi:hypothetical protein